MRRALAPLVADLENSLLPLAAISTFIFFSAQTRTYKAQEQTRKINCWFELVFDVVPEKRLEDHVFHDKQLVAVQGAEGTPPVPLCARSIDGAFAHGVSTGRFALVSARLARCRCRACGAQSFPTSSGTFPLHMFGENRERLVGWEGRTLRRGREGVGQRRGAVWTHLGASRPCH